MADLRTEIADYLDKYRLDDLSEIGYLGHADALIQMVRAEPGAGTSAYQMVAVAAKAEIEVTDTLMQMLAATVMMNLWPLISGIDKAWKLSVTYSPLEMARMTAEYEMNAVKDGTLTTVTIQKRDEVVPSVMQQYENVMNAKPQAAPKVYDRPVWAILYWDEHGKHLARMLDQRDAQRQRNNYRTSESLPVPQVQNRWCMHIECPASGCTHAEKK